MKVFKINETAYLPEFATEGSAAFDLRACLDKDTKVKSYNPHNRETIFPTKISSAGKYGVSLQPQFRTLIPTGLIFDIPRGNVVKLYSRSGMSLKFGLHMANDVGIIDSDYIDEVFMMIINDCDTPIAIYDGDRLAQGMLEATQIYKLEETFVKPEKKTSRSGGFGSTGISELISEVSDEKIPDQIKQVVAKKSKLIVE